MRVFIICLVFLAGCDLHFAGGQSHGGEAADIDPATWDVVDDFAPDGGTGDCRPAVDECAAGLTCRHIGGGQGECEPVGTAPVGAACTDDTSCGPAMTCLLDGGARRCFALCDRREPTAQACAVSQVCDAYWGAELSLGICI